MCETATEAKYAPGPILEKGRKPAPPRRKGRKTLSRARTVRGSTLAKPTWESSSNGEIKYVQDRGIDTFIEVGSNLPEKGRRGDTGRVGEGKIDELEQA
jgi:hypothetical protein